MSKDLKHRVKAIREQNRPDPLPRMGLALFGGFILLAIVAAGYLHRAEWQRIAPAVSPAPVAPSPPRFSYFKILPDIERKIPDADIAREKREVRLGKKPMEGQFFIQPGSFRKLEQAENLKNQLETYGKLKPRLEKIQLEFATWYRVKLGPYRTLPDADQVRLFLREREIDSIVQTPVDNESK